MTYRPQIISNVQTNVSLIAPTGSRNAAMIGTAQWGPINVVTDISNLNEYSNIFKDDISGTTLTGIKGADLFFRNGGTLKFVRVEDGSAANSSLALKNGTTTVITLSGKYKGSYGNNIIAEVKAIGSNRSVIVTDGINTETYDNLGVGFTSNAAIVSAINANSQLVTAVSTVATLVAVTASTQLTGGVNGTTNITNTNYIDILSGVLYSIDYNFLLIPSKTDDIFQKLVVANLNTRASSEKLYSRYITGVAKDETTTLMSARTSTGSRITVVAPGVKYLNRFDGVLQYLDGSYLASAYAGMLCNQDLEISGTHKSVSVDGLSINEATGTEFYTKNTQESVLGNGIAPIAKIGNSISMIRAVTRVADKTSIYFDGYITDIVDEVTRNVETYLNSVVGNPKTQFDMIGYESRVDSILENLKTQQIIETYQNSSVTEGASPDTLVVSVSVKPTFNTNFVLLTLNING